EIVVTGVVVRLLPGRRFLGCHGDGGLDGHINDKPKVQGPGLHGRLVGHFDLISKGNAVDDRAVGRAEVLDKYLAAADEDAAMLLTDRRAAWAELALGVTANDELR